MSLLDRLIGGEPPDNSRTFPGSSSPSSPSSHPEPELARRVQAFRVQLEAWQAGGRAGIPLFGIPGGDPAEPRPCLSCGQHLPLDRLYRCEPCETGVRVVLATPLDHGGEAVCSRCGEAGSRAWFFTMSDGRRLCPRCHLLELGPGARL